MFLKGPKAMIWLDMSKISGIDLTEPVDMSSGWITIRLKDRANDYVSSGVDEWVMDEALNFTDSEAYAYYNNDMSFLKIKVDGGAWYIRPECIEGYVAEFEVKSVNTFALKVSGLWREREYPAAEYLQVKYDLERCLNEIEK